MGPWTATRVLTSHSVVVCALITRTWSHSWLLAENFTFYSFCSNYPTIFSCSTIHV